MPTTDSPFASFEFGGSRLVHADCFEWLRSCEEHAFHAIVTDPPYGVKEFDDDQLSKRANGSGGVWRIPPAFDGHTRSPLPRFTALDAKERARLYEFFSEWGRLALRVVRPGGHAFVASNAFISLLLFRALTDAGWEFRGEVVRLVRTLRGGDRPKNAEAEFSGVCSMARGRYEPWGVFRRPLGTRTVSECLRRWQTGGLRRYRNGLPFEDVVESERTPQRERDIADHPSLKPQSLLRRLVWASLPLGEGIVLDPFAGSGSTVAAAEAIGARAVGIERHSNYVSVARRAIPRLQTVQTPDILDLVGSAAEPALFDA